MTNDFDEDLRDTDAAIDALLEERCADATPPDLTDAVVKRHARGDGAAVTARLSNTGARQAAAGSRRWLAAAVAVLGLGAVAGTLWMTRDQSNATAQQPVVEAPETLRTQDPKPRPQPKPKPAPPPRDQGLANPMQIAGHQDPTRLASGELSFELRVTDRQGGPIQDFEMSIVIAKATKPLSYRRITSLEGLRRHPRDFRGDYTTVSGLAAGTYAIVVRDGAHALTISAPFQVRAEAPTRVTVAMNSGGELRGRIVDPNGQPIVGAAVRSKPNNRPNVPKGSPFEQMLTQMLPKLHTEATALTDAAGRFRLRKLTYGNYALEVQHADYCIGSAKGLEVSAKPIAPIEIHLQDGAVVHGTLRHGGEIKAGAEVIVSSVADDLNRPPRQWRATSNESGLFRFAFRLPPGRYTICPQPTPNHENPFQQLIQMRNSQRPFTIQASDHQIEQNVDLK